MTIYWPWGELKNAGFQNEPQEGYLETTPDAGTPYRRQRFSDIGDILSGSLTLSKFDYIGFMSWYNKTIKQGSIAFQFYDTRIDTYRTARFMGKPSYNANSTFYNVELKLYLEPTTIEKDYELITDDYSLLIANDGDILTTTESLRV